MAFPTSRVKNLIQDIKEETLLSTPKIAQRIGVTKAAIYNILNEKYDTVRAHLVEDLCVEFNYTYEVKDGLPYFYKEGESEENKETQTQGSTVDISTEDQEILNILKDYNVQGPKETEKLLKTVLRVFSLEELNSEVINNLYTFSKGFLAAQRYQKDMD